jgi:hypothetical protein
MIAIADQARVPVPSRHLVAVSGEPEQLLGHLVFYSIPEEHIAHDALVEQWLAPGLERDLLPRPPTALGTFRAACQSLERRREDLRAEEAHRDERECAIQLTAIVRDPAGRVVDHPKLARLTLDRSLEVIRLERFPLESPALPDPGELAARARRLYRAWRRSLPGAALRRLVRAQLLALSASPVRESGGVYFVPRAAREQLGALAGAVGALTAGRGEFHRIPLADDASQRAMVRRHFVANCSGALDGEIARLRALAGAGPIPDGALAAALAERRRLGALKAEYAAILSDELAELDLKVGALDGQLARLVAPSMEAPTA